MNLIYERAWAELRSSPDLRKSDGALLQATLAKPTAVAKPAKRFGTLTRVTPRPERFTYV